MIDTSKLKTEIARAEKVNPKFQAMINRAKTDPEFCYALYVKTVGKKGRN